MPGSTGRTSTGSVCQAIACHHGEVAPETVLDHIIDGANQLSGARPGARRELLASYIKRLEDLEKLASSYTGVTRAFVSSNIKPIPFSNGAAYSNPQVDALFTQAASTVDRTQRAALYGQIQDILVQEVPYWWITESDQIRAIAPGFHDLAIWSGNLAERAWLAR